MTDYHPVTKEELEQIRSGLNATKMMNEVLSRPDPLALLIAWRLFQLYKYQNKWDTWDKENSIIKQLRENPEAVRQDLIDKGVWKE